VEWILYSKATEGGGALIKSTSDGGGVVNSTSSGGGSTQTSSSGGASTQTSSSGGGVSKSTASGGGSVVTSEAKTFLEISAMSGVPENSIGDENYGYHVHEVRMSGENWTHDHTINLPSHSHNFDVPNHTHTVSVPAHTHTVNTPSHTHEVNIPNHTHEITLPDHIHDIEHGIYELSTMPTSVQIRVDGNLLPITALNGNDIDIIPYLDTDSGGKITRGTWHTVEITPNDLARINANIISRLFIQSRMGGTY